MCSICDDEGCINCTVYDDAETAALESEVNQENEINKKRKNIIFKNDGYGHFDFIDFKRLTIRYCLPTNETRGELQFFIRFLYPDKTVKKYHLFRLKIKNAKGVRSEIKIL